MTSVVVWDLGGTVCRFEPERRLGALATATGMAASAVDAAIWGSGLDRRCELGELSPQRAPDEVLKLLDDRLSVDKLRACWAEAFIPDPSVVALVEAVPVPCALLTNNGPLVSDCLAAELATVGRLFHPILCSWQLQARKPTAVAFERAASVLQRPTDELLLVDDQRESTDAALANGWDAVTFTGASALKRVLEERGLHPARR